MSYLLEIVGQGLLTELGAAFREVLCDDEERSTGDLRGAAGGDGATCDDHIALGIRLLRLEETEQARAEFERAVALDDGDVAGRIGLACVLDDMGRTDEALEQLSVALEESSDDPALLFAAGYCCERIGLLPDAVGYYVGALQVCPGLRNAHERLAAVYVKQGAYNGAIKHYEQLCAADPISEVTLLRLANLYHRIGDFERAADLFRRALTLEPDNRDAREDLVATYESAGMIEDAIAELNRLVDREPERFDHHVRLGDLYAQTGEDQSAVHHYEQAARLQPNLLEADVKLGTLHLRRARYREAIEWFNKAVENNDRLLNAYVGLGVAQHESGLADSARRTFQMAAGVEPNSTLLFSEVAKLQLKMAAGREAEQHLAPATAVTKASERGTPVDDLLDRQIERHRQVLRTRPNHADVHYRLGMLLRQRGELDAAIESFRHAVAINPNYVKAIVKLGLSLAERGDEAEAVETLQGALRDRVRDVELHYQLGLMFADRNKFALALEQYEAAIKEEPRNIDLHANLALALQNMGLLDRAALSWETLCDVAAETEQGRAMLDAARGAGWGEDSSEP